MVRSRRRPSTASPPLKSNRLLAARRRSCLRQVRPGRLEPARRADRRTDGQVRRGRWQPIAPNHNGNGSPAAQRARRLHDPASQVPGRAAGESSYFEPPALMQAEVNSSGTRPELKVSLPLASPSQPSSRLVRDKLDNQMHHLRIERPRRRRVSLPAQVAAAVVVVVSRWPTTITIRRLSVRLRLELGARPANRPTDAESWRISSKCLRPARDGCRPVAESAYCCRRRPAAKAQTGAPTWSRGAPPVALFC
jgi:hypothetical protein